MGSGPDALATGLLCVDNLTLIEHIGNDNYLSNFKQVQVSNCQCQFSTKQTPPRHEFYNRL